MLPTVRADRKALLLGSALASTLLFAAPSCVCPTSGFHSRRSQSRHPHQPLQLHFSRALRVHQHDHPWRIDQLHQFRQFSFWRVGIATSTLAPFAPISVQNSGALATAGIGSIGIAAVTASPFSPIAVLNSGDIATIGYAAIGISANAASPFSPIAIINSGDIATLGVNAIGIQAATPEPLFADRHLQQRGHRHAGSIGHRHQRQCQ